MLSDQAWNAIALLAGRTGVKMALRLSPIEAALGLNSSGLVNHHIEHPVVARPRCPIFFAAMERLCRTPAGRGVHQEGRFEGEMQESGPSSQGLQREWRFIFTATLCVII